MQPGTNLAAKVTAAIDRSEAVVVLVSDNSVDAPYVHQEIGYALKGRKLIIPLVQPGITVEKLAMLQGLEFIPFDFEHPHEGTAQLRAALQKLLAQQQAAREQREALLVALACIALVLLALDA